MLCVNVWSTSGQWLQDFPRETSHSLEIAATQPVFLFFGVQSDQVAPLDEQILDLLGQSGPMSAIDLGRALHKDRSVVRPALLRLHQRGAIEIAGRSSAARSWGDGGPAPIWAIRSVQSE